MANTNTTEAPTREIVFTVNIHVDVPIDYVTTGAEEIYEIESVQFENIDVPHKYREFNVIDVMEVN